MERFIKEYANYTKSCIIHNDLMKQDIKQKALEKIKKSIRAREKGLITVDETMKLIMNCFE